jgi:hypothetical protein
MYVFTAIYVCITQPPESAPDPMPGQAMQVNGTVMQGGRPLFAGAVEARVGGSICGAGAVLNGRFELSVASSTTIPGCGMNGATVTFRVNGSTAEGSVLFTAGGSATVELAVAGLPGVPGLPTIPNIPGLPNLPGIPSIPPVPGVPGAAPSLVVTGVTPNYGPAAGGTPVTFTGTGFSTTPGATQFAAAQYQFTGVSCASTTTCTAVSPSVSVAAGSAEIGDTISVTVNGQSTANQELFFVWYGTPRLASLAPSSGPAAGGTAVTLTGSIFPVTGQQLGAASVRFGTTPATGVSCSLNDTCTATAPAGSGTVQVTVTTPGGTSNAVSFTYTPSTGPSGVPGIPVLPIPVLPIPTIPPVPTLPAIPGLIRLS